MKRLVGAWLVLTSACASAPAAFGPSFADNDPARTAQVARRLDSAPDDAGASGPAVLVATTHGEAQRLLAFDLERGALLWSRELGPRTRPDVLGDLVLCEVDGSVAAFDLRTGKPRWRAPTHGLGYMGAARSGDLVAYVTSTPGFGVEHLRGTVVGVDATGRVRWRRQTQGLLGKPTALAGLLMVPWGRQNLVVLEAQSGVELARVRLDEGVVEWVDHDDGQVYFGDHSVQRFDERVLRTAWRRQSRLRLPVQDLPGSPRPHESAFEPRPARRSAYGRIQLVLEPETGPRGAVELAHDRFYEVYYRYVFGFDASAELRWARMFDDDVIAARAHRGRLVVVHETGRVQVLSGTDGRVLAERQVGESLASAELRLAGWAPEGDDGAPAELRTTLAEIALDPDNRLVPARIFALQRLAELPQPDITLDLLGLYERPTTPNALREAVREAVLVRERGTEHLVDALRRHYDFLRGTPPPPLEVIAPALARAGERRALAGLTAHLFDHATPAPVLPVLIDSLAALGGPDVTKSLGDFLRLYHADSSLRGHPEALLAAARALVKHGGDEERAQLEAMAARPETHAGLSAGLERLLSPAPPEPRPKVARRKAEQTRLPRRLDQEAIRATFSEHADELRECIAQELAREPELTRVRVAFIVSGDGSAQAFRVIPDSPELLECLEPKLRRYRFARFSGRRQMATFSIAVHPYREQRAAAATNGDAVQDQEAAQPWWAPQVASGPPPAGAEARPWWQAGGPQASTETPAWAQRFERAQAQEPEPSETPEGESKDTTARQPAAQERAPSDREDKKASGTEEQPAAESTEDAWWRPAAGE